MGKPIMDLVLPRLARPLYRQLERFQTGQVDEAEFTANFEALLRKQHAWLARRGVAAGTAAMAIHAAVLILSMPGLRVEAVEAGLPLEIVEFRAIQEAAEDVAQNYDVDPRRAARIIAALVARYGD